MRVFVAFPVDKNNVEAFLSVSAKNANVEGIKWTLPENLHLTLYFIGEIKEEQFPPVQKAVAEVASSLTPFTLQFDQIVLKGKKSRPSMIWASFKRSEMFSRAVIEFEKALAFTGIQSAHKDPSPHCTLARIKNRIDTDSLNLFPAVEPGNMLVDSAAVWQSTGGIYIRHSTIYFKQN